MTNDEFRQRRIFHLMWTQKEAAEALGLTVQQISHIENGRTPVNKTVALLFSLYRPYDRPKHPHGIGRRTADQTPVVSPSS